MIQAAVDTTSWDNTQFKDTTEIYIPFISSPEPKAHGELIVYRSIRRPSVRP